MHPPFTGQRQYTFITISLFCMSFDLFLTMLATILTPFLQRGR
ncbi:MAG: hypothetical protein Nkreftii_000644 [Candidatus Nitrospira kreftii]|uniref:Uncharacterized protein n=1 Tax=Candidatus Nitrospira kreftii TaxID=2652173 RepID=A0A7S8FBI4_9BACT|nr:MAG: hypothetical protein Nkreftii_000644 [Candidatus Nitrospira kreftii]